MGEKQAREHFRVAQYSAAHPALTAVGLTAADTEVATDTSRTVVHFDVDAFYAQAEEVRDPSLTQRPLGAYEAVWAPALECFIRLQSSLSDTIVLLLVYYLLQHVGATAFDFP